MSDYNEPWGVKEFKGDSFLYALSDKDGKLIEGITDIEKANRIVRCVNACKGMSDEEVERIPAELEILATYRVCERHEMDSIRNRNRALKAQLAEARELLEMVVEEVELCEPGVAPPIRGIKAFLEKGE